MEKVDTSKGPCDDGIHGSAGLWEAYRCPSTDMWEDASLAQLEQCELCIVGVGRVVFEAMTARAEQT